MWVVMVGGVLFIYLYGVVYGSRSMHVHSVE